jgi:di/tricarboxylate transporter
MMQSNWWRVLVLIVVAAVVVLLAHTYAEAQCSMCRASLTSITDGRFIRNFNIGVLVLLVPPATMFCSIFVVLKRYKKADDDEIDKDVRQ